MSLVIELKDVCKSFKNTQILDHINLEVSEGEILGIVGPNGCGKSVLYKIICGLMLPTSGQIRVNGKKIRKGEFAEDIGIMLDITGLLDNESGFANLKNIAVIENKITDEQIKDCIKLVGLNPNDTKPVKKYSLGMKQRLKFAIAIMEHPRLLLLDEPFNALDKEVNQTVKNILLDMNQNEKVTILITSHNTEDIRSLCTRVIELQGV